MFVAVGLIVKLANLLAEVIFAHLTISLRMVNINIAKNSVARF